MAHDHDRGDDGREDERSEARERALSLLYEADAKQLSVAEVLDALVLPPDPLAELLVRGVAEHQPRIDGLISSHARNWTLERMPVIDRTVLRIGVFELLERPDVPVAVVLNEAVELAKRFSTDDSGRFVNGVLAAVAREVR
ncbi:MAG TPA: transcription antitermination factor NusB [Acidimicrobiales bacterium]